MMKWVTVLVLAFSLLLGGCGSKNVTQVAKDDGGKLEVTKGLPADRKVPKITLLTMTPEYEKNRYEASMLIRDALMKLGLEVEVKPSDIKVVTDVLRRAPWNFDGLFMAYGNAEERVDPQYYLSAFTSANIKNLGANRFAYSNPEYDKLASDVEKTMDINKRKEFAFKAQELLARDVAIMPLYFQKEMLAYNKKRLDGVVLQAGIGAFNYHTAINVKMKQGDNILKVINTRDITLLNPLSALEAADLVQIKNIFDFLVRLDADGKPMPSAAEKIDVINDTTIKVKIKPNQQFHDGTPLTAEDIKFTYDFGKKWGFAAVDFFLKPIDRVEVNDPLTVTFYLKEAAGYVVSGTFVGVPIIPKHIWEDVMTRENVKTPRAWASPKPIGSGPFKFTYWRPGEELRMDTFKEYHTPAKIEALIFMPYRNPDAIVGALEKEQMDMHLHSLTPVQVDVLKKMSHIQITESVNNGFSYFGFNLRRKPWDDKQFRIAMAHAINLATVAKTVLGDTAMPAHAGGVITPGNPFWHNPNVTKYPYDLKKARQILKDAGYAWDEKGSLYFPKK